MSSGMLTIFVLLGIIVSGAIALLWRGWADVRLAVHEQKRARRRWKTGKTR